MSKTEQKKLTWTELPTGFRAETNEGLVASFKGPDADTWAEFVVLLNGDRVLRVSNSAYEAQLNPLAAMIGIEKKPEQAGFSLVRELHRNLMMERKREKIRAAMDVLQSL